MWTQILTVLLTLQPYFGDQESPDERVERMVVIAKAIDYASARGTCSGAFEEWVECRPIWRSDQESLAAALIVIAQNESNLALHVHQGRCGPKECDAIMVRNAQGERVLYHQARSLWQVHYSSLIREEWPNMAGTSLWSTSDAAWASARMLAGHRRRCLTDTGMFGGYGTGGSCTSPSAQRRAAQTARVASQIRRSAKAPAEPVMVASRD